MQLFLDTEPPVLVTRTRSHDGRTDTYEFHTRNENGTTSLTMAVVVGNPALPGDLVGIGQAVRAVLS